MARTRVWIDYHPRLYTDLFARIIRSLDVADVLDQPPQAARQECPVDVVVVALDSDGQPDLNLSLDTLPSTKVIAFSANGEVGLRHMPGCSGWEEIRPFGLKQFVSEVINLRNLQNA